MGRSGHVAGECSRECSRHLRLKEQGYVTVLLHCYTPWVTNLYIGEPYTCVLPLFISHTHIV